MEHTLREFNDWQVNQQPQQEPLLLTAADWFEVIATAQEWIDWKKNRKQAPPPNLDNPLYQEFIKVQRTAEFLEWKRKREVYRKLAEE
jgi:hypothetical protein